MVFRKFVFLSEIHFSLKTPRSLKHNGLFSNHYEQSQMSISCRYCPRKSISFLEKTHLEHTIRFLGEKEASLCFRCWNREQKPDARHCAEAPLRLRGYPQRDQFPQAIPGRMFRRHPVPLFVRRAWGIVLCADGKTSPDTVVVIEYFRHLRQKYSVSSRLHQVLRIKSVLPLMTASRFCNPVRMSFHWG